MPSPYEKLQELQALKQRVQALERELAEASVQWPPTGFYWEYYATTGFLLGIFGAMVSLLAHVIGAPIAGKSPLELIRVYLTFPLGEPALRLATGSSDVYTIGDGVVLAVGCCLYLATGMVLGVPVYMLLVRFTEGRGLWFRWGVATLLGLGLWVLNFYALLSWMQPALTGGNWITDPRILPPWVAALTHLIFSWTMAALYPLGRFQPYQPPGEA